MLEDKVSPDLGLSSGDGVGEKRFAVGFAPVHEELMDEVSGPWWCEDPFPEGVRERQMCRLLALLRAVVGSLLLLLLIF